MVFTVDEVRGLIGHLPALFPAGSRGSANCPDYEKNQSPDDGEPSSGAPSEPVWPDAASGGKSRK